MSAASLTLEGVVMNDVLSVNKQHIAEFCRRWRIDELALFGSVLRDDFGPDSDIDVLVTFAQDSAWSLFDHVAMRDELVELLGRPVDLVNRAALEESPNHIRRNGILEGAEVFYAA
jgi:predicted nucleotidyltransferase